MNEFLQSLLEIDPLNWIKFVLTLIVGLGALAWAGSGKDIKQ